MVSVEDRGGRGSAGVDDPDISFAESCLLRPSNVTFEKKKSNSAGRTLQIIALLSFNLAISSLPFIMSDLAFLFPPLFPICALPRTVHHRHLVPLFLALRFVSLQIIIYNCTLLPLIFVLAHVKC